MQTDVIIVGAGPAGCICALELAECGHSVTLLDRSRFPRAKACGGWVNRKVFEEFPALEQARKKSTTRNRLVEEPYHGLVFHSPDLSRTAEFGSRSVVGYGVLRKTFDARLLDMVRKAGCTVYASPSREVTGIEVGENGVAVQMKGTRPLKGRLLVGADGANSTVARLTDLRQHWTPERQVMCLAKEISVDTRTVTRLFGKQRKMHVCLGYDGIPGYGWIFPKRNSINIGIGCRSDAAADLRGLYGQWAKGVQAEGLLPERCDWSKPLAAMEPAGGALDFEGHVGKRTVLIGDAGGFVSTATGEGIFPALLSARIAAQCIDRALATDSPQDALLEFKFAWRRAFAEYIQMPNANLGFLLPLIFGNKELCRRLARCYLFGDNF